MNGEKIEYIEVPISKDWTKGANWFIEAGDEAETKSARKGLPGNENTYIVQFNCTGENLS